MTTTATATTIARYTIITTGGSAASYRDRDNAQIEALRDSAGVLSDIEVVVSWGGHEGRATIDGAHTVADLTDTADDYDGLLAALAAADTVALMGLIRDTTDAHTEAVDLNMETIDYAAVRADVAAALGEEPHPRIPTTRQEALEWIGHLVPEDFVEIVPA